MYISVDMGGTNTRVAGIRSLESIDYVHEPIRRRNTMNYENDLDFIVESARKIAGREAIKAVGIGTPGTPNPDRTRIASAIHLPFWNDQPLTEPISESLDCPVFFENDAVTAGLGEAYYGNQRSDFHYLIWGTGMGGASIERDEDGKVSYVEKLNWREHFYEWGVDCCGAGIEKKYGRVPETLSEEEWHRVRVKFDAHLLKYVENFGPDAMVFGGGLADKHRDYVESFARLAQIDVSVSDFGNDSGIVGSFGLIRYEIDRPQDAPRYDTLADVEK